MLGLMGALFGNEAFVEAQPPDTKDTALCAEFPAELSESITSKPDKAFNSRESYFVLKRLKLQEQFVGALDEAPSFIFKGMSFHITGHTIPTLAVLRSMIVSLGGIYEPFFFPGRVSHMVSTRRPNVSGKMYDKVIIILPTWIVDCHKEQKLLDYRSYLTPETRIRLDKNSSITKRFKPIVDNKDEKSISKKSIRPLASLQSFKPAVLPHEAEFRRLYSKNSCVIELNSHPEDFIRRYYSASRLHHISTWKQSLIYGVLQQFYGNEKGLQERKALWDSQPRKIIAHIDIDCFFAQVSLKNYSPDMANNPGNYKSVE